MHYQPAQNIIRNVKPLLSTDHLEAKRRVLNLYRAWYREIPEGVIHYKLPKPASYLRAKLREEFLKHKNVTDIRVIDMLVIKGEQDLNEFTKKWSQTCHVMNKLKDTVLPRPNSFIAKFIAGVD